ncbi:MAG: cyclase family protein [Lachnospiraceae bacterium]|nr:cyclase family protein [Lachnospiraceae bacterium]
MKIYDISQEIFGCEVYPGDMSPQKIEEMRMERGDLYNLTSFQMCAHNGTHVDAPFHFYKDGKAVEELALEKMIGFSFVVEHDGLVTAEDAREILRKVESENKEATKRILLKGDAVVTLEAAEVFAEAGIWLIGGESQSVGPEDAPMAVHKVLLGAEVVLLEGIRLQEVPEGVYFLNAAPLSLAGADGAPCRAILIEF